MLTPVQIEDAISALSDQLEAATDTFAGAEQALAEAEAAFKRAYLTAFTTCQEKTVSMREHVAEAATVDEWTRKRLCEATVKIATERMRTLRGRLDAFRTLAANVRALTS